MPRLSPGTPRPREVRPRPHRDGAHRRRIRYRQDPPRAPPARALAAPPGALPRRQAPFRACVLSALDDTLASDELFGHVAGAFTGARESRAGLFASAAGGTVFLDEIGKASLAVQQKLLHVIEYHEIAPLGADRVVPVDVRVVAASNLPLEQLVRDGTFLPDLYARLKCFRIALPPLRARAQDIPHLVTQCLSRRARECGYTAPPAIDEALMAALTSAPWPDNLRELDGTMHRLLVEADGADALTTQLCVGDLAHLGAPPTPKAPLEIEVVRRALAESDNKKARAARLLGVSRSTVHRVLRDAEMRPIAKSWTPSPSPGPRREMHRVSEDPPIAADFPLASSSVVNSVPSPPNDS